jgi:hypothetical protein
LVGDDAPSKQIYFSLAMSRSKGLQMLRWQGKIHHHHCHTTEAF